MDIQDYPSNEKDDPFEFTAEQQKLSTVRIALWKTLRRLQDASQDDDYVEALFWIVKESGKEGVTTDELNLVFPNRKALKEACNNLWGSDLIEVESIGSEVHLTAREL